MAMAGQNVMVLNTNTKREVGRGAQLGNVAASRAVADIIRTTLGPRSMLKMLLDPMGGIVMTNDGNCILREVDVSHPAAKSMIELARAQDEEVGDGTTSVIVLAGEMLAVARPFIDRNMHPTVVCRAYNEALQFALGVVRKMAIAVVDGEDDRLRTVVRSCIGTKFVSRFEDQMVDLAVTAVKCVQETRDPSGLGELDKVGKSTIDIKRYAKVEKIPGGELSECRVLTGVMFNKDVTHAKMSRSKRNPRVLLLDCPLEYKKGESNANIEIMKDSDWDEILRLEEEYIQKISTCIIKMKPDVVITEKGLSDLCQHYLVKAGISAIRRIRKTDNNRIARVTGATICNRVEEITEADIGTDAGLFEVRKIGDEYFTFIEECKKPKACTILLRGASKDVLNEIERNLQDAMQTARNVLCEPLLLPGGGAVEMHVAQALKEHADKIEGSAQWPFAAVGDALEVIPRTLCQNCGGDTVRVMSELRSLHAEGGNPNKGIDGATGQITDMAELGIFEAFSVKVQTIKTAIESAIMLLRIDDICSGSKPKNSAYGDALNSGQLDDM
jgi:T-complex protein 1 subunit gamma